MKGQKYEQFVSTYEKAYVDTDHSSSQNKTDSSIAIECRICLQEYGPFITPCKCGGTMRFVHEICLKKWACEKVKKQVQKDEEKAKGRLSPIHGVECELCREIISMEVQKKKLFLNWTKAKENSQDNFLPFVPLFLLNSFLALACFTGIIFVGVFSMLIVFQHEAVDYKKYIENPLMTFGLLGLSLILCGIFMAKSMIQLYYMFVKEEHEVIKIIPSMAQMTESIKQTQPDQKTKQYHTLETMSTPTTPHSISQILLQNQLSLTRKNFTLKKKIAKEIAQRKLAKLPEFKNENEADTALNQLNQINFGVQVVLGHPQK